MDAVRAIVVHVNLRAPLSFSAPPGVIPTEGIDSSAGFCQVSQRETQGSDDIWGNDAQDDRAEAIGAR